MIAKAVAGTDKKVTLELGGKAANIVFDDAPLDQAIEVVNGVEYGLSATDEMCQIAIVAYPLTGTVQCFNG